MQDMNLFYQQNHFYVVYPVWNWQWGFLADGKILHCEKAEFL